MTTFELNIDMDKRCPQCNKKGVVIREDGTITICLDCRLKELAAGKYDHILKGKSHD